MESTTIIFAKLQAAYKYLQSILARKINGNLHQNFDPQEVEDIYNRYIGLVQSLQKLIPELYSDLPIRTIPEASPGGKIIGRGFLESLKTDFEYIIELYSSITSINANTIKIHPRVFISHGTSKLWLEVQNFIEKDLRIDTLELAQEAIKGRSVLQKLNEESDKCSYAVVIMTGDDTFLDGEIRVRENVMHEIGFFQGKYGFDKVCLLHEEGTNIPSNIQGLVYISFPKNLIKSTFGELSRELKINF